MGYIQSSTTDNVDVWRPHRSHSRKGCDATESFIKIWRKRFDLTASSWILHPRDLSCSSPVRYHRSCEVWSRSGPSRQLRRRTQGTSSEIASLLVSDRGAVRILEGGLQHLLLKVEFLHGVRNLLEQHLVEVSVQIVDPIVLDNQPLSSD